MQKKTHNNHKKLKNNCNNLLRKGSSGIKINDFKITSKELENKVYYNLIKKIKKIIKSNKINIWNKIHFNKNLTKLNLESRMGKGKGSIYTKATFLKPGDIIYEFDYIPEKYKLQMYKNIRNILKKTIYINRYNN